MNFLTRLTLLICLLSASYTALMMLVPDRFRREMRSVLALVAVVTLGAVLSGADFSDISDSFEGLYAESPSYSSEALVQQELEARLEEYVAGLLNRDGIRAEKISVRTTIDGQSRISITEASLELDSSLTGYESRVRALIVSELGDIEVKISYGE